MSESFCLRYFMKKLLLIVSICSIFAVLIFLIVLIIHSDIYKTSRQPSRESVSNISTSQLEKLLNTASRETMQRYEAIKSLGKLGDKRAVPFLIKLLKDKNFICRNYAAEALGRLSDRRAVLPLVFALKDTDETVRLSAVEALGLLSDKRAVSALINVLNDKDLAVRYCTIQTLLKLGDPQAVKAIINKLNDNSPDIRALAAKSLVAFKEPTSYSAIMKLLDDKDVNVRAESARALADLSAKSALPKIKNAFVAEKQRMPRKMVGIHTRTISTAYDAQEEALWRLGVTSSELLKLKRKGLNLIINFPVNKKSAFQSAMIKLYSSEKLERAKAMHLLGTLGDLRAIEPLAKLLREERDAGLRATAIIALRDIYDEKVVPYIIKALKDNDESVQMNAISTLNDYKDKRMLIPYIKLLLTASVTLKPFIAQGLAELGDKRALKPLKEALAVEKDEEAREAMKETIKKLESLPDKPDDKNKNKDEED